MKNSTIVILFCIIFGMQIKKNIDIPKDVVAPNVISFVRGLDDDVYGTGFYIQYRAKTFVVTNKHICEYGKLSGSIKLKEGRRKILHISKKHDLCLIESKRNWGLNLAGRKALPLEKVILVGHPRGIPLTVREGRIIGPHRVCFSPTNCLDSQRISAMAYGGNSGSPVTNEYGRVIGVLFAGNPNYPSEPFIVPYKYLKELLEFAINKGL